MDEEMEEVAVSQAPKPSLNILPAPIQAMLFGAVGESLLLVGALFFLVGFASFAGSLIGIKGSGEILTGILLVALGFVLVQRSRVVIREIKPPSAPPVPQVPQIKESGKITDYR
jgi:hypothetical protein